MDELDKFLETLKVHNKDLDACFNDAVAVGHLRMLIKQARNTEIEALVTHIQDKFEEVEVLLNEYQYIRTRAIDAEDALTEGGDK